MKRKYKAPPGKSVRELDPAPVAYCPSTPVVVQRKTIFKNNNAPARGPKKVKPPPSANELIRAQVVAVDATVVKKKKAPPLQSIIFSKSVIRKDDDDDAPVVAKRKAPPTEWKHPEPPVRHTKKSKAAAVLSLTSAAHIDGGAFSSLVKERVRVPSDQLASRHRPSTFEGMVGNVAAISECRAWLESFEAHEANERALLLVGPTGCGKTTLAHLLLAPGTVYSYSPFDYVEHKAATASEKRNGKTPKDNFYTLSERGIYDVIHKLAGRSTVFGKFGIVLEDLGTMKSDAQKALVAVITGDYSKQTLGKRSWQAPFILTCDANELDSVAVLARACRVVHLSRPSSSELLAYCARVCQEEALEVPNKVQRKMVEGSGGDVRRLLNTLQFFAVCLEGGGCALGDVIDCTTAFYDQCTNMDLVRRFLSQRATMPLHTLDDLADVHPVSLAMLLAQNYPSLVVDDLDAMAGAAEHMSSCDEMDHIVYGDFRWELQDTLTTLSTWGLAAVAHLGAVDDERPLDKSEYKGWKQKESYRKKLMAGVTAMQERGVSFVDVGSVLCAYLAQHTNKSPQLDFVAKLKDRGFSYADLQDVWKACHLAESEKTLRNPRGQYSIKKLLE